MNLRQLEVFQAVLQTGNMSAAARLLCITPSAVSKTVAHTELQLGYRLFVRTPAGLTPTPEAQVLATESTGIHRQLDALRRVHVPILRGSLFTAALLVFVDVMKELPATLVMRPFNFDTLATQAYTLAADERLTEASTAALAIVAVGLLPLIALSRQISRARKSA